MTTREILSAWEDSSLETEHSGFLLGAGHTGALCLEHTNFLDSQKESWCSADWFRPDRSLGTGSSSYWSGTAGHHPEIQVPRRAFPRRAVSLLLTLFARLGPPASNSQQTARP